MKKYIIVVEDADNTDLDILDKAISIVFANAWRYDNTDGDGWNGNGARLTTKEFKITASIEEENNAIHS